VDVTSVHEWLYGMGVNSVANALKVHASIFRADVCWVEEFLCICTYMYIYKSLYFEKNT
jgi:hypothetical protein